ncbi:glycosyltransferase family 4 protein [Bacteroides congonensis]|uniref:glycosyltransferase family 4 protein n=1 Tax=Bacteroides congonensis TaxID=1871006 RepID=UPI002FD9BC6F
MKILWITNILFEHHRTMVGLDFTKVTGGSWLNAAYVASLNNTDIQLYIATSGNNAELMQSERDGNVFYIVPGGGSRGYDVTSEVNLKQWQNLRSKVNPDAVIVWGTETRFAYVAMKAMVGIPIAIYMQGVIESIYDHYFEGIPRKYQNATFRDFVDKLNKNSSYRNFRSQVFLEREMFRMATGVIVENDWCEDMCKSVNPNLKVFRNNLPIRDVFQSKEWSLDNIERQSIFTNAGGYPIKGHHILFQALGFVKKRFPNFKCYIPGPTLSTFNSIKRQTGYSKMLNDLIDQYDLPGNIIYTGSLSSEEMVDHLATCNVYVMPSVMENHSSSLIEAMMVGAPSVGSLVGGTASLVRHRENALLYNSLDTRSLAGNIIRVFEDDVLAERLSEHALKIREERASDFGEEINHICKQLIEA